MQAARVEDNAHRVLALVRGQRSLAKARAQTATQSRRGAARSRSTPLHDAAAAARHRHVHTTSKPATGLAHAKAQALMAVYGLRHTPLADQGGKVDNNDDDDDSERLSEAKRRELLETRRRVYRNHFSGLQATYGPSGRPKLDTLIDAAMAAKRKSSRHAPLAVGAAVLTSANRIYASGRLESVQDAKFDVCAERAALLKLMEHQDHVGGTHEVVEAVVICSDQRGLLPVPCGACRELLAEFGDFPVFLLNAENDSKETRSFELFPLARHSSFTATAVGSAAAVSASSPRHRHHQQQQRQHEKAGAETTDPRDWTCEQVVRWLETSVELPQYAAVFADKRVDGATLWQLADSDLQLLLGIVHPLHRRRLLLHVDRLKDRELLEHGIDFGQLQDYIAVLDRDRLDVVAQLKATFDRLDANRDGMLTVAELAQALQSLGADTGGGEGTTTAQLLLSLRGEADGVSFPAFVRAFSQLAQLPAGETKDAGRPAVAAVDLAALRETFNRADTNKSGSIDEQELVALLRSLGRDQCEQRAREWFRAVDEDGDARLSFAEFFLRYAQLTRLDLSAVRAAFYAEGAGPTRTPQALERALQRLHAHVDRADIAAWCRRRAWAEVGGGEEKETRSSLLSFASFALACAMYANALRLRVAQLREMQRAVQNDALCHRSRIVHLQQSGHVRLCRHPGGGGGGDAGGGEDESVGARRRRAVDERTRQRARARTTVGGGETKEEDEEATEEEEEEGEKEERRVMATFRRLATAKNKTSRRDNLDDDDDDDDHDDDGKQQESSSDGDEDARTLNAVEAAQALQELGVACARDQLLRYLDREGFGLRRAIDWRAFRRLFTRLKVFQEMPRGLERKAAEAKQRALWEAIGRAAARRDGDDEHKEEEVKMTTSKTHASRRPREHDAALRRKAKQKRHEDELRGRERRKRRSEELRRGQSEARRWCRSSSSSSSSSPSGGRRSRIRSSDDSGHGRNGRPRHGEPSFRGFEVGDRVVSRARGAGTLVRLFRAFFVADVRFDSGELARNVDLSQLRRLRDGEDASRGGGSDTAKRKLLVVGTSVRVAHRGTKTAARRGTILRCRTDGTFDVVANECGEQELLPRVPLAQLVAARKPVVYSSGARVTVKRKHAYLRGAVVLCRTNGSYDVRVAKTQRVLREVAWELLAPDEEDDDSGGGGADDSGGDDPAAEEEERRRDDRKPRPRGRRESDSDDKEEEEKEAKRRDNNGGGGSGSDAFEPELRVGDRVEARFQGQAAFYGGRVTRVHGDGACDITYDDGDAEQRVASRLIRRAVASRSSNAAKPTETAHHGDAYEDDFDSD